MKKLFAVILLSAGILPAIAQPTLNYSNTGTVVGDAFILNFFNPAGVSPGSSGANVTWDFSTLPTAQPATVNFVTPASTPYAGSFPGANIAFTDPTGNYYYYSITSQSFSSVGIRSASGVLINYSDPQDLLRYPFTYNSNFVDDLYSSYTSGVPIIREGTVTTTADGYGTLILPWGTINNVLRVKTEEDYTDDYSGGWADYTAEGYYWFVPGTRNYLFRIVNGDYNGTPINTGTYIGNPSVGIAHLPPARISATVYPNPSVTGAWINADEAGAKNLLIYDLAGKKMDEHRVNEFPYHFSTATYPVGNYWYELRDDHYNRLGGGKLVVGK